MMTRHNKRKKQDDDIYILNEPGSNDAYLSVICTANWVLLLFIDNYSVKTKQLLRISNSILINNIGLILSCTKLENLIINKPLNEDINDIIQAININFLKNKNIKNIYIAKGIKI